MSAPSVCLTTGASLKKLGKRTDITDITCSHHKLRFSMQDYIQKLREISEKSLAECKRVQCSNYPKWEPLEIQIKKWWANLPPALRERRFQITEIAAQCKGKYQDKPALRQVAAVLRTYGWREVRVWKIQGRNCRLWIPPGSLA